MSAPSRVDVSLRNVTENDLPEFFRHQIETAANRMAAFTSQDPTDREAFGAHWNKILSDDAIEKRTIVTYGRIAGYLAQFERLGKAEVCLLLDWTRVLGKGHCRRGAPTVFD